MDKEQMLNVLDNFNSNINDFPIGASSLENEDLLKDKIQNTREVLKQMNAKILRLRTLVQKKDSSLSDNTIVSSVSSLMNQVSNNLLNKRILSICLYSNAIINRILERECSEETFKKVIKLLNEISQINDKVIALSNVQENLFIKKLSLSIEYQKALYDYNQFLEDEKEKENQKLQSNNPKLAAIKKQNCARITKINTMKRLITNMIAGSSSCFNEHKEFRYALENHSKLVHLDDFKQNVNEI